MALPIVEKPLGRSKLRGIRPSEINHLLNACSLASNYKDDIIQKTTSITNFASALKNLQGCMHNDILKTEASSIIVMGDNLKKTALFLNDGIREIENQVKEYQNNVNEIIGKNKELLQTKSRENVKNYGESLFEGIIIDVKQQESEILKSNENSSIDLTNNVLSVVTDYFSETGSYHEQMNQLNIYKKGIDRDLNEIENNLGNIVTLSKELKKDTSDYIKRSGEDFDSLAEIGGSFYHEVIEGIESDENITKRNIINLIKQAHRHNEEQKQSAIFTIKNLEYERDQLLKRLEEEKSRNNSGNILKVKEKTEEEIQENLDTILDAAGIEDIEEFKKTKKIKVRNILNILRD